MADWISSVTLRFNDQFSSGWQKAANRVARGLRGSRANWAIWQLPGSVPRVGGDEPRGGPWCP